MPPRTHYVGTFAVDAQISLTGPFRPRTAVRETDPPYFRLTSPDPDSTPEGQLHIDGHRAITPKTFSDEFIGVDLSDPISARILVSGLGVGYVLVSSHANFSKETEQIATRSLQSTIREFSDWLPTAFPDSFVSPRPGHLLPGGQLLWWHRLLGADDPAISTSELWGFVKFRSSKGAVVSVGDGFTIAPRELMADANSVQEIMGGIMAATDDWLIADTTNRELERFLNRATNAIKASDERALSSITLEGERLVQSGQLLRVKLDARDRYLVFLRGATWSSARKAWGLEGEMSSFEAKTALVHDQIRTTAERLRSRRDNLRNAVLFAIALLTAFQSSLILVDFAVHPEISIQHPMRAGIAGLMLVLSLGVGLSLIWRWVIHRKDRK